MNLYNEQVHFVGVVKNKPIIYAKGGEVKVEVKFDAIKWQDKNTNLNLANFVLSFSGRKIFEAKKCREGERVIIVADKISGWPDEKGERISVFHLSVKKIFSLKDGAFEKTNQKQVYLAEVV